MKISAVLAAVALAAAALVGCSSGGSDGASSSAAPVGGPWATSDCTMIAPPTTEASLPEGSVVEGQVATTAVIGTAPVVGVLEGAVPASSLVIADIVTGSGDQVAAGATVTVEYCGVGLASGAIFDSSWARGEPATFPLSGVITGWQDGIPGMQPGGRRMLVIPADQAYGDTPQPGSGIAPGETLIFVVDMISSP
jgi:peptidylprolyl isomerase